LPVQSKNPILILLNAIIISFIIVIYNINIIHARSRAPAWSCFLAAKLTFRKIVTTFHGTSVLIVVLKTGSIHQSIKIGIELYLLYVEQEKY